MTETTRMIGSAEARSILAPPMDEGVRSRPMAFQPAAGEAGGSSVRSLLIGLELDLARLARSFTASPTA